MDKLAEEILDKIIQDHPMLMSINDCDRKIALETAEQYYEAKLKEITDADIEVWADRIAHLKDNEIAEGIESKEFNSGLVIGAKAMRDGKIKHIG